MSTSFSALLAAQAASQLTAEGNAMNTTAAADAQRIGAMNDLSIATEFLQVALREIAQGTDPGSPEVRQWIDFALAKVQPIAAHAETPNQPS